MARRRQAAAPRHLQRDVGGGARGDRQPEVHQPPAEHAEGRDAAGNTEADQQQGCGAVDDAEAARGDGQYAEDVGDPVGGEQLGRVHVAAERRYEAPQGRGVEQPVERRPRQRRSHDLPVADEVRQRRSDPQEKALEPVPVRARDLAAGGMHDPGCPARSPGEPEREGGHQYQRHRADDGDRHVDRVEARDRYRDHQGQPQQDVQDDRGPHALGRHHHRGVRALHALRGEQLVSDPRAAHRAGRDDMRHRGRCQVDAEQPGQPRSPGRRQQRTGEQGVAEQRHCL